MDDYNSDFYSFFLTFYKVGDDNKVLKNETYEIYSIDDVPTGIVLEKNDKGRFIYYKTTYNNSESNDVDTIVKALIPNAAKEKLATINNMDDVRALAEYGGFFSFNEWNVIHKTYVSFPIPIKLKQIVAEGGYRPRNIIIEAGVNVDFNYQGNTNVITSKSISIMCQHFRSFSMTNDDLNVNTLEDLMDIQYVTLDSEDEDQYSCINTNAGMIITEQDDCRENDYAFSAAYQLVPYFVAERGTITFEIDNTVNGVVKYNASKEKDLEYKITVKNTGDVVSTGNEITTHVPKEVTVNESKISDDGEYNKNEHTITWNIDRIEVNEQIELTYSATAPDSVNGKELIGYSTVKGTYVAGVAQSSNTVVTLDRIVEVIQNPETGTMVYLANTNIGLPLSYLIVLLLIISLIAISFIKKVKKLK